MVCGEPLSVRMKSSLVRFLTSAPCLSRTVARAFTTFTLTETSAGVLGAAAGCEDEALGLLGTVWAMAVEIPSAIRLAMKAARRKGLCVLCMNAPILCRNVIIQEGLLGGE